LHRENHPPSNHAFTDLKRRNIMSDYAQIEHKDSHQREPSRRDFLRVASGIGAAVFTGDLLTQAGRAYPANSSKKIRLAVVGGGFGASFYWHQHPNCVVTGVTDLYPQRRKVLKKRYKCDKVYDSLEIMVKEAKDIDAVAVFSGGPDHVKHAKMCMERGWHVVSAVPACASLEQAALLKEVKEKTGLHYMMAESSYYRQQVIFARNLFQKGLFGQLFYSEVEYHHDKGKIPTKETLADKTNGLFYNPDGSRSWRWGYPPMWYPTHALGCLVSVTKERFVKVSCLGWRGDTPELRECPAYTDNAYNNPFYNQTSLLQTNQGHMCRHSEFRRCVSHGERAQWFGDQATLYMSSPIHGDLISYRGKALEPKAQDPLIPQYWKSDMLPEAMRHESGHGGSAVFISAEFINALLEDREPTVDVYEALAMTVPGLVAQQSALKDGEQMSVPQFDPPKKS
jgi:predicted dehydrogenase